MAAATVPTLAEASSEAAAAAAARSEVLYERRQGRAKMLLVRGLDVSYSGVQVLFGVDFEIDEGEIVAAVRRQIVHGRYAPSHIYYREGASQAMVDVLAGVELYTQKRFCDRPEVPARA